MTKTRRRYAGEQKAKVVRRHLVAKEALSDLADELALQPSQIHMWVKQVIGQAERAFERLTSGRATTDTPDREVAQLLGTIASRNAAIALLAEALMAVRADSHGLDLTFGISTNAINPRGRMQRSPRQITSPQLTAIGKNSNSP
jgi:transposase-like protein